MRARSWVALAVWLAAPASPAHAQAKPDQEADAGSYWGSIFADFFLGPERKDEFRWSGRIAPGATLEIKGVNGRIVASASAGREIELVAVKRGRRQDPKEVEIAFVEHAGGLTVCAVYPSRDGGRPNDCQPGRSGRMNVRNNDVQVEFTLKVPAGVSFVARTVNGSVRTRQLDGNVEAYTVNGSVRVDALGHAQAETVNGSIRAVLGRADWSDPLAFRTVNGSVRVVLPASADVDVRVETVNGQIETQFPLNEPAKRTRRELQGRIGSGGRELRIKTVNGSVALQRAS